MSKKKILIATDGFLPRWDGISSFLNEVIPRIQDDYSLRVIAPDLGEIKKKYKAKITRFKTLKIRIGDNYYLSMPDLFKMRSEIKKSDMVWVQCLGPIGIWGILIGKLMRKPVAIYNHMVEWEVYPKSQGSSILKVPLNVFTKFFGRMLYGMCDMVIVPSVEHAELLNVIGVKNRKRVVHLGVDTDHYKPKASNAIAKNEIGIDPKRFVVGYGGRVSLEKDLKTLYRAFKRLSKKYKNALLLIAGGGRPELEAMFSGKENIVLTGLKDDLLPYYQAMDVYVMPSLVETTSLTTMEAMSTGTAVIATPVGFIKEYIDDGINGMLFPKKNSYELFKKIELLMKEPETRNIIGKNARETMVKNYSWDKTVARLKEVLEEL